MGDPWAPDAEIAVAAERKEYESLIIEGLSVTHSQLFNAVVNAEGVDAMPIDSYTPQAVPRDCIEAYRRGKSRMFASCGALAQGFDAPATRAAVIARATYSLIVYQQMIGRGLRGPKNGGEGTCLILDVKDNIENFGQELAITQFEHHWTTRD